MLLEKKDVTLSYKIKERKRILLYINDNQSET